ncbi:hypothetical protein J422_01555 [Methanocaldococcus villosus KIN24-T80]|uniref:Uncharacterized protein n=1 Tax=Methanocaldococcus villosus KIN24-T80 TaxID=1069083 RepID=N6VZR4_9EURY|nr:hypothetical protein [Methanocaldococcus villosus]ENN96567.1 hypothetical protein J422_01555 [Methanocaldococcus villosus KIN24-T80]
MIKIRALIEVKGNIKNIVDKEFERIKEDIKNYNPKLVFEETEEGEFYTKIGEFEISFNNLLEYLEFCLKYGADIEVVSPDKLVLDVDEINKALAFVISFFKKIYEKYNVVYKMDLKEKDINVEEYKLGRFDEDEILELSEEYIRVKCVFEGVGKDEETVIKKLISTLDSENIIINKVLTQNFDKDKFNGLVAIDMFCKPFELFEIAYKFLPIAISVQKNKVEINLSELQDIGNELSGAVFEIAHIIKG